MGGRGEFSKPPEGPKIGPAQEYSELSDDKKRELGDLAKAAETSVFTAAPLDPRLAEEAKQEPDEGKQQSEEAARAEYNREFADVTMRSGVAAENFDALGKVLDEKFDGDYEFALRTEAEPTDADKQEFLRCVLANKRYSKTYKLFGSMIEVTMTELVPAEEDFIFAELSRAQAVGAVNTEADWSTLFERLHMAYCTTKMSHAGKDTQYRDPDKSDKISYDVIEQYIHERFCGDTIYRAVMHAMRLFRLQLERMLDKVTDSDFWTGDGQASQSSPTIEVPSTTAASQ